MLNIFSCFDNFLFTYQFILFNNFLINFMIGSKLKDKFKQNETEIFKIQTQIRAELNHLRKTVKDAEGVTKKYL